MADFLAAGMNDRRLKPRLLRSLTRDGIFDEARPFPALDELSSILESMLSLIKTHGLLSEPDPSDSDKKLVEVWKSAFDTWLDRVLALASSNLPDKRWAGICLLGLTCEECSSGRFKVSFPIWFQKLLPNIQPPSSTRLVKMATCASLGDIFRRLVGVSNLKKDATSLAGKLIQPVLQLLDEDGVEAQWEVAIDLLCTLVTFFPSSIHRHYDNVESVLVSKILSTKSSASKKFACCLALLPKMKGDEHSWCLMMRKVLIAISTLLNDAFQGLEDEAKKSNIMRLLVPPGEDPPPPLGGQTISSEESEQAMKRRSEMLIPRVSTLMYCCCVMLNNPFPVQVTVNVHLLLAFVRRVLFVDGSLHGSVLPFTTALHQEVICAKLPALHLDSLDLLLAVIKGVRSQLLPYAAGIGRLLTEYFSIASLPSIRVKVYSIVQTLLISMGAGMALELAQEVIKNASFDLSDCPGSGGSPNGYPSKLPRQFLQQYSHKKRRVNPESDAVSRKSLTPLSVKVAALRALEALLTVGGSLDSEHWRTEVDSLLIDVATNVCDAGWASEELSVSQADLQLAALEALLASFLSPAHVRPPFLSQGLELFRRGKRETGTRLAAFCAHALLALEVLIHPRALPLVDFPGPRSSTHGLSGRIQKPYMPSFSRGDLGVIDNLDDDDDDFYNSVLANGEETAADEDVSKQFEIVPTAETPAGKETVENTVRRHEIPEGRVELPLHVDVEMESTIVDDIVESNKEPDVVAITDANARKNDPISNFSVDGDAFNSNATLFPRNEEAAATDDMASINASDLSKYLSKGKECVQAEDSDTDSSSIPDIVDVDPDSD